VFGKKNIEESRSNVGLDRRKTTVFGEISEQFSGVTTGTRNIWKEKRLMMGIDGVKIVKYALPMLDT
jgi:hypothetical protein